MHCSICIYVLVPLSSYWWYSTYFLARTQKSKIMQLFSLVYLCTVFSCSRLGEHASVSSVSSCIPRLTLWWWDQDSAGNTPSVAGLFALLDSEGTSLWLMRHPPKSPTLKSFHDGGESETCKSLRKRCSVWRTSWQECKWASKHVALVARNKINKNNWTCSE